MAQLKSHQKSRGGTLVDENMRLARHGLSLPKNLLQALEKNGIYCFPGISVKHQHLSDRFVLRGTESGGSVEHLGRYCGYLGQDGQAIPWLQPLDSFGGNGRHAIVIATDLVRIEMLRIERTYELLISRHVLSDAGRGGRPELRSIILYRGREGALSASVASGSSENSARAISPIFHTGAGEVHTFPPKFAQAIQSITSAVECFRCKHTHIAVRPHNG